MVRFVSQLLPILFVTLWTVAVQAQPAPSFPLLSEEQVTRLNAGEVLVDVANGEVPIGDVLGVIDAPPARVLEVIMDFDNYDEFMPDMDEAEIISRDGEYYLLHGVTDTPWPMEDRSWTIRAWAGTMTVDGVDTLISNWTYVPGSGNLEDTQGYWLLIPWGDGEQQTLVRYYLLADLGTILPDFLITWASENLLPEMVIAVRARVAG